MITSINQLTDELMKTLDALKNGDMPSDKASTIARLAGTAIAAERVKIKYARSRNEKPESKFMES